MAIWRMRIACCITKATGTHSEYVILTAFPLQQWLQERASMSHYTRTYTVCLVSLKREAVYNVQSYNDSKFSNIFQILSALHSLPH